MYGILFRAETKPGKYQALVDFTTWDAEVCRDEEPGTLRFEFYQDAENENAIYVYEAYRDQEAFEFHKQNEPYQKADAGLFDEIVASFTVVFDSDALVPPAD